MDSIHPIPKETNSFTGCYRVIRWEGKRSQCTVREIVKELNKVLTAALAEKGKIEEDNPKNKGMSQVDPERGDCVKDKGMASTKALRWNACARNSRGK